MNHLFTFGGAGVETPVPHNSNSLRGMTPDGITPRQAEGVPMDIFSRLMMDRIIYIGSTINDDMANIVTGQLLYLASIDPEKEITLYINSPGGDVSAGLAIYDTMKFIRPDVATVCLGTAASMAAVLLCAGAKGRRAILPHARVMIHQPLGAVRGQAADMAIAVREVERRKQEIYGILAERTGQPIEKLTTDADRDYWLSADEAVAYGMVDLVVGESLTERQK
jgi:ATP-dependent Clp protease protease subunit